VKEELFACGEEKLRAAINALEQPILEFHVRSPRPFLRTCMNYLRKVTGEIRFAGLFPTSGSAHIFGSKMVTTGRSRSCEIWSKMTEEPPFSGPSMSVSPVPCGPFSGSACEPALL
jgi:hypothetical protein